MADTRDTPLPYDEAVRGEWDDTDDVVNNDELVVTTDATDDDLDEDDFEDDDLDDDDLDDDDFEDDDADFSYDDVDDGLDGEDFDE